MNHQPLSSHWADIAALKLLKTKEDKDSYVLASGITPSGLVHIGNFRETITVDLVKRALEALGKKVTFLYSWDNFDTFRKVPKNLPDPKAFEEHLSKPIARIPDPWGQRESYAQGRMALFEEELRLLGIHPKFRYQENLYSQGTYAFHIRHVLENLDTVKTVLNGYRTEPLKEDWLPTSIYCAQCSKDVMEKESYLGEWAYFYRCASCHHEETVDIRTTQNLKLAWRLDWPMRWHHEKVDFEPGGKDHSSQGGSFDTGKELIKALWKEEAPSYLQYDFVMIKGGAGKMSSSSGELFTPTQVMEVYEPQIVRWIFANQRPNHDFALAFDEDVIKVYEEFDRSERLAFSEAKPQDSKWQLNRRTYELSLLSTDDLSPHMPVRAAFRVLCNRLQICSGDINRTYERFYSKDIVTEEDKKRFWVRSQKAWFWLQTYASTEFCYALHKEKVLKSFSEKESLALSLLAQLIQEENLETMDPKTLNERIWEKVIRGADIESSDFFILVYQQLIGREQGPRLPGFLKEIGREKLLELL